MKKYIRVSNSYDNKQPITNDIQVILPDGILMHYIQRVEINLNPLITPKDRTSHIFPYLQSEAWSP